MTTVTEHQPPRSGATIRWVGAALLILATIVDNGNGTSAPLVVVAGIALIVGGLAAILDRMPS